MRTSTPLRHTVVLLLLFALLPGMGELVENAVHVVAEGHAAHAPEAGDEHSEPGPEHGCNGTFHLCSCHASLSFLALAPSSPVRPAGAADGSRALEARGPRSGFHQIPERPPRA